MRTDVAKDSIGSGDGDKIGAVRLVGGDAVEHIAYKTTDASATC